MIERKTDRRIIRGEWGEPAVATVSTQAAAPAAAGKPAGEGPRLDTPAWLGDAPERERSDVRRWAVPLAAVVGLGLLSGWWLSRDLNPDARAASTSRPAPAAADEGFRFSPASEPFVAPDASHVRRALSAVRADFAAGGMSQLARESRGCYERLSERAGYAQLDYCIAYDLYGAAVQSRLAGQAALGGSGWFDRTDARALAAARGVMGEEGDAAARLIDLRRLTTATAASATPARVAPAAREAMTVQVAPAPSTPAPAERVVVSRAPEPVDPPAPVRTRPAAEPPAPPVRVVSSTPERAVERAAPRATARPSFNCRYARSSSERMVCNDPVLAAADWRLHNVFERAMADADRPGALRREQDRWLAAREAAAPDPAAVLQVYESRIDELNARLDY